MATHPIGQYKTTKNPQSLTLCGFLGLRWSLLDRYLVELGTFEFNAGRISLHGLTCRQRLRLARQINQAVSQLRHNEPLPDM